MMFAVLFYTCFHFLATAAQPTSSPTRPTDPQALEIPEPLIHTDNTFAAYTSALEMGVTL